MIMVMTMNSHATTSFQHIKAAAMAAATLATLAMAPVPAMAPALATAPALAMAVGP